MTAEWYLNRPDAFGEMARLRDEMNRLFNGAFAAGHSAFPPVNVWAEADEAVVTVELPGMDPAELHLSVQNNELLVEGARKEFQAREGEEVHRRERTFGPFRRSVPLPFKADPSGIEAKYRNGVLSVRLPRHEAEKPRKIQINATA
jgi:HSP20 family protein